MVEPNTKDLQKICNTFVPDDILAVIISTNRYDASWEEKEDEEGNISVNQSFDDLDAVKDDCRVLKDCLEKFGVNNDENIYELSNPTNKECK